MLVGQLFQPLPNRPVMVWLRFLIPARPMQANQGAELSHASPEGLTQLLDSFAFVFGRYDFFETISLSI